MSQYIHLLPNWPSFIWDQNKLTAPLSSSRLRQGRLLGRMEGLGFPQQRQAELLALTQDVVKSSEIEGEVLDAEQVRSSVARRLGVDIGALKPEDRRVEGVVEMTLDATADYAHPLSRERLFQWHRSLFREAPAGVKVGAWRDDAKGPMQVVSGALGREKVHYEAPAAARIEGEMARFLAWANGDDGGDLLLRAALAHLWFVTVHPFDDGNGRVARAIADWALARSEGSRRRFYSMSAQIRLERRDYYDVLERTQKGSLDVTDWLLWFLACLERAIQGAEAVLDTVVEKDRYWKAHAGVSVNARQRAMLNRLLDGGFVGKLSSTKWAALCKCSHDTAGRDIQDLVGKGLLEKNPGGGRSTSYRLKGGGRP